MIKACGYNIQSDRLSLQASSTSSSAAMAEVDPRAAAQMQAFIAEENQKAAVQQIIAKLTDTCWDKCMSKPGNKLSSWETDCISNCAERFLDASIFIVQRMHEQSRQ
jgi:mitochondrial import inner membrane translocase subunit TIM8